MDDAHVTKYIYNGATFYFVDSKLESFKLTSSDFYIQTNLTSIKIGNNISSLSEAYPDSYNYRKNGNLSINIGEGDYKFLLIEYNLSNVITCIEERTY